MADNDIKIYGALRAMTGEGKAAYASQIYDETQQAFLSDLINNGFKGKIRIKDSAGTAVGYLGSDGTGKMNIKANDSTFTLQATAYDAETQQTATTGRLNITKAGDVTLESSDDLKLYGGSDVKIAAQTNVVVSAAQYAMLTSGSAAVKVRSDGDVNMYSSGGEDVRIRNGGQSGEVRLHATPNNVRLRASENCNMTVNAPVDETATPIVYNNNIRLACGDVEFYLKTFDAQGQQVGNDDIYSLRKILTASVVRTQLIITPPATLYAQAGYYYCIDGSNVVVNTMTIQLPSIADYENKAQNVSFFMTMGSTPAVTFVSSSNDRILYQKDFALEAGKTYEVNALYQGYRISDNPLKTWVIAAVEIEIPTT